MNKLSILIIDDDTVTTNTLRQTLDDQMHDVHVCSSAKECHKAIGSHDYDIIIYDIEMPGMNGFETLRTIRQNHKRSKIAIFADFDDTAYMLDAIKQGVSQFFSKPFDKEHFIEVITDLAKEVLDKRKTEAELNRQQNIMHTIKEMSEKFLQHDDWNETLHMQMKALKDAAEASSIFIFKNQKRTNPITAERYLSINDDYEAFTPNIINYRDHGLLDWKQRLSNGEYVNATLQTFTPQQQSMLRSYKIDALLILPVFAENEWWGFLGIGNAKNTLFDNSSLEVLQTVARIIGSAINNQSNLRSHEIRSAMFDHTVDGIVLTDADNRIISINKAFSDITGFTEKDVLGKDPKILKSSIHDKAFYQQMWEKIRTEGHWQGEIKNRRKNDQLYIEWLSISAIKDAKGRVQNYMGIFSDVTAHRASELKYAHLATHDALTGLANRLLLDDRLDQAISHAKRQCQSVAVIFCDLDNFKPINDTYGHTAGDLALKECSDYFCSVVREEDTVARYGGDEFVIVLGEIKDINNIASVTEKILNITEVPFDIGGQSITLQMSTGISFYPQDADNTAALIQKADEAMYRAKKSGKNRLCYYKESPEDQSILTRPSLTAILSSNS